MTNDFVSEVISISFLAFAISMDAFSVSLSYGLKKMRLKFIFKVGLLIGLFHFLLPFIGIIFGQLIFSQVGYFTSILSALLLIGVGFHMLFSAFQQEGKQKQSIEKVALISLAFVVSLDSFSVGLTLGMSGTTTIFLTLILFGMISTMMTWSGLLLGRKLNRYVGIYSEILGSAILISFGLHILFI